MIMPGRIDRYVLERLSSAASSLAIHPGRIKERLVYILDNYILGLDACCFPEPLRHRFNLIKAIVLANDKTTRETVESMTEDAACDLAKALTELADELLKLNERRRLLRRMIQHSGRCVVTRQKSRAPGDLPLLDSVIGSSRHFSQASILNIESNVVPGSQSEQWG